MDASGHAPPTFHSTWHLFDRQQAQKLSRNGYSLFFYLLHCVNVIIPWEGAEGIFHRPPEQC